MTPRRASGGRVLLPRARAAAGLATLLAAVAAVSLLSARPAAAHTALASSTPGHRSVLAEPPETVRLVFTDPVDPRRLTVSVTSASDGAVRDAPPIGVVDTETTAVEYALPALDDGTYGVAWESVGADGHRAAGEVVFTVGPAPAVGAAPPVGRHEDGLGRGLDVAAGFARFSWYGALSLVAGGLSILWWSRSGPPTTARARFAAGAGRWLRRGLWLGLLTAAARGLLAVAVLARAAAAAASGFEAVADAFASRPVTAWVTAAFLLAGAGSVAAPTERTGRARLGALGGVLLAVAAVGVLTGHAASALDPPLAVLVSSAHLVAAAVWVGPLAVVSLGAMSAEWRAVDPGQRRDVLRAFFPWYARVGAWALGVLVVTGVHLAWTRGGTQLLEGAWGTLLLAKVAVILLVAAPMALHHDRLVRQRSVVHGAAERAGSDGFLRTVRTETVTLTIVLGLAAALTGLGAAPAPPPAPGAGPQVAPVAAGPRSAGAMPPAGGDSSDCAALPVGGPDCYRAYFADRMRSDGAEAALTEIGALSETDPYVGAQCHQVTHDLGRDAAEYYPTLSEALAFDATVCWSGYYHGVVEQELSGHDEDWLLAQMPTVCAQAATDPYSFGHYNCVHGLGHGVMLRLDGDLFAAIPFCERFSDQWERSSCLGGLFMQNVVSAQHGLTATVREGDLRYPCNAVDADYVDECYLLQTSYVLWQLDYDYAAAFAVCDEIEDAMRSVCYQSMGRDISGASQRDVSDVVARCALGRGDLRDECYVGAARDAVYTAGDGDAATPLCEALPAASRGRCLEVRDEAAARL